jgi:cell division protein FtsI (penicillin-binding protein 3)
VLENEPTALRRVVSVHSAQTTTDMLRRVVEEEGGTGTKARLDDFPVAGKTGTAQKVDPRTGGYSSKRIGSFVGFAPADQPRVVVLVLIDEPGTTSYGGIVAAPVFRAIAGTVLKRLGVVPARPTQLVSAPAAPATPPPRAPAPRAETPVVVADGMPSFLGLSLREAVSRAHEGGWRVSVSGSGYVAAQQPSPGSPPAADRRLALRLDAGQATASP